MTHNQRRLIAFIFILSFLVSAPILLLYASGLRYNPKRGILRGTGAITIETRPKGARVYVNDELKTETTPIRLTNLLPNIYSLRVVKAGYTEWVQRVSLEAGENALFTNIRLFPRQALTRLEASGSRLMLQWQSNSLTWALFKTDGKSLLVWYAPRELTVPLTLSGAIKRVRECAGDNRIAIVSQEDNSSLLTVITVPLIGQARVEREAVTDLSSSTAELRACPLVSAPYVILDTRKQLYVFPAKDRGGSPTQTFNNIDDFRIEGDTLIFWNAYEIYLWHLSAQAGSAGNASRPYLLTRSSETITSLKYVPALDIVFFTTPQNLSAIEAREDIERNMHVLSDIEDAAILGLGRNDKLLYVFANGGIYAYSLE